ncbi:MAG TPA: radical SAM family heme chaperone HemW [Pyrinomonadaceae bacterium]|nr:radical SAM family heme chaperone HemW [Pyrinomonadaceae bacterium]
MKDAGIYIHIPFCRSRCSYCDFATGMYQPALAERYVHSVVKEISNWQEVNTNGPLDTIFFGGGTPSLLSPTQVDSILRAVRSRFELIAGAEITLEINPGDCGTTPTDRLETLSELRRLGINRASFGAQTFDDHELRHLGRTHTSADIQRTFRELREVGFDNINFDLIAGLPGQRLGTWSRNLDQALALRPEHLSLYLLEVHEGTPLADQIRRGQRPKPDDDLAAEMYQVMIERLCAAGYEHYEISNFCRPGFAARHNTKYWTGLPYYGFGCSAHSYDGEFRRWANERDVTRYADAIDCGDSVVVERTVLSESEVRAESVFLGMRMMRGINVQSYQARFGADPREVYRDDLARFREAGLVEFDGELIRLTRDGALLSNEVFAAFV